MELPFIVIGGGGHSKVLLSTLLLLNRRVYGFVDPRSCLPPLKGITYLGDDSAVFLSPPDKVRLVNGVGAAKSTNNRTAVYEKFKEKNYIFWSVVHPSVIVAPETQLEEGVQLMAGVVVQPGSCLGENVIVNTGARVDHDCSVDAHAHIAPGAILCGNVRIGKGAHIGTGANILPGKKVGAGSIVGAGAVVVDDVPPGITVLGIPARPLESKHS